MTELERCCFCDNPTGRAGIGEDSIYLGSIGPFCEDCYREIEAELLRRLAPPTTVLVQRHDKKTPMEILNETRQKRDEARALVGELASGSDFFYVKREGEAEGYRCFFCDQDYTSEFVFSTETFKCTNPACISVRAREAKARWEELK